jgi:hypothetical protein
VSLIRVLRTAKATLNRTFYIDELPTGATGNVVVTVSRLDGTIVEGPTNATGPDANQLYTYVFGGRDVVDELIVSWAATVSGDAIVIDSDHIQVAGGFLFSLSEGRGVDTVLASQSKYPTARLIQARLETEDECERICGQAFVPRFCREVVDGRGESFLKLRWPWIRAIRSISVRPTPGSAYAAMTAGQLAVVVGGDDGVIRIDAGISWPTTGYWWGAVWPMGRSNVIVEYEHGLDYAPPDLVRGAKIRFKSLVLQPTSALPDRAERIATTETGVVILASPSEDRTGIPEVDACYGRHSRPVPSFG